MRKRSYDDPNKQTLDFSRISIVVQWKLWKCSIPISRVYILYYLEKKLKSIQLEVSCISHSLYSYKKWRESAYRSTLIYTRYLNVIKDVYHTKKNNFFPCGSNLAQTTPRVRSRVVRIFSRLNKNKLP